MVVGREAFVGVPSSRFDSFSDANASHLPTSRHIILPSNALAVVDSSSLVTTYLWPKTGVVSCLAIPFVVSVTCVCFCSVASMSHCLWSCVSNFGFSTRLCSLFICNMCPCTLSSLLCIDMRVHVHVASEKQGFVIVLIWLISSTKNVE